MNYLFIQLNNIDIPEERFDILSIGEGIDVEMYLESPAHLLTYKGEEMTDVVEQSSIREDLGKYDFMALRSEERRVGKECRSRWSPYH